MRPATRLANAAARRNPTSTEPRATGGSDQRAIVSPRRLDLDRISLVICPVPLEVDREIAFSASDAPFIDFDVTPAQARHLASILLEEADGTDLARTTCRLEGAISAEERLLLDEAIAIERGERADPAGATPRARIGTAAA